MFIFSNPKGQSLMEVIVAVAVGILMVSALVFATIFSLRNANFAKNQAQATKLAQEGIERIRSLRNRDGAVDYTRADGSHTSKFSDLWSITFSCPSNCYFVFNVSGILTGATSANFESVSASFKRQFKIEEEGADPNIQKKVTAIVLWSDFAGDHQSQLITILRKL